MTLACYLVGTSEPGPMMPRLLTPVPRLASSLLRSSGRKCNGAFSFSISQSINGSIPRRGTPNFDPQRNFEAPQAAIVLVPKLARRRFQHMRDASCCHPSPLIHTAAKTVSLMNALVCQTSTEFKTEYNEARRNGDLNPSHDKLPVPVRGTS